MVLTTNLSGVAARNIFLSAAILFMSNTFQGIKKLIDINVSFINHTTFNAVQKKYLFPSIQRLYTTNRYLIIYNATKKRNIDLLGDGRCASPNCNGKYGTYTVHHKIFELILDFNVSHVRTAGNVTRMELDGLK